MHIARIIFATLFAFAGTASFAQTRTANPNTKISPTSFQTLAQTCAANVPVSTLEAIARTESALYPYALSINRPHQLARRQGWNRATITLERQPTSLEEAIAWTKWLLAQGITVSIGLLQVNSEHAKALHLPSNNSLNHVRISAQVPRFLPQPIARGSRTRRGPPSPRHRALLLQQRKSGDWLSQWICQPGEIERPPPLNSCKRRRNKPPHALLGEKIGRSPLPL